MTAHQKRALRHRGGKGKGGATFSSAAELRRAAERKKAAQREFAVRHAGGCAVCTVAS